MKPAEKEKLRDRYNTTGVEIPVARDGLSIYLHATNPINELTMDQLKQIFTGKITNWKGPGRPRHAHHRLLAREQLGHLRVLQGARAGRDGLHRRAQTMPGTGVVVNAVSKEKNGIGYGGAATPRGSRSPRSRRTPRRPASPPPRRQ